MLRFLEALSAQAWGKTLYAGPDGLWKKLRRRGLRPPLPTAWITLSTGPRPRLSLGPSVEIAPDRLLEFTVDLIHDGEAWLIESNVWVDLFADGEGQRPVRSFPVGRATSLDACLTELAAAVADLATCDDVLDQEALASEVNPPLDSG